MKIAAILRKREKSIRLFLIVKWSNIERNILPP